MDYDDDDEYIFNFSIFDDAPKEIIYNDLPKV